MKIAKLPNYFLIFYSFPYFAPFGLDPDGLPIDKIGENIRTHVMEILH
ncbi:MAG: hypothetical protein HQ491_00160 [Bacteroidetes bacterium]|nr:hypothetical protein [Bacteroidota bacterium]